MTVDPVRRYRIRELDPEDIDGVMEIERVSFPSPWSASLFLEEIGRPFSDALVAVREPGDEVIGYAVCWTVADESHLLNIAVRPEARGKGVGRALLRECVRRGALAGATRIHLEVRAGNDEAIGLYRSEGFAFVGVRKRYYTDTGEDALLFAKEIARNDDP